MTPSPVSRPRRALRWLWRVLAALVVLVILAVLSAPWWFDAQRVAALALAQASSATGLSWTMTGQAELRWQPAPWLALSGISASDEAGIKVLTADRLEVALPWSTLRGEALVIDALQIDGLDLDLDAALAWWEAQPAGESAELPTLSGLSIINGRLRWASGRIEDFRISVPRFAPESPVEAAIAGRLFIDESPEIAFAIALTATPRTAPLRFEALQLQLTGDGPLPSLSASGDYQPEPWALTLNGELPQWPAAWPTLPDPLAASDQPFIFALSQRGSGLLDSPTQLRLRREDVELALVVTPAELLTWLDAENAGVIPPLVGRAQIPALTVEGAQLQGVDIRLDEIPESPGDAADPSPSRSP